MTFHERLHAMKTQTLDAREQFDINHWLSVFPKPTAADLRNRKTTTWSWKSVIPSIILYWVVVGIFHLLREHQMFPDISIELPQSFKLVPAFLLASSAALLAAGSRFLGQTTKNARAQLTGAIESWACIIGSHEDKEIRDEGFNLLRYLFLSLLMFCLGIPFEVIGKSGRRGRPNSYYRLLTDFGIYARKHGMFPSLITSSAGLIRWVFACGLLKIPIRYKLRHGNIRMPIMYFVLVFVLIALDASAFHLWFGCIMLTVVSYLMAMLVKVAHNEASAMLELAGSDDLGGSNWLERVSNELIGEQQDEADHHPDNQPADEEALAEVASESSVNAMPVNSGQIVVQVPGALSLAMAMPADSGFKADGSQPLTIEVTSGDKKLKLEVTGSDS